MKTATLRNRITPSRSQEQYGSGPGQRFMGKVRWLIVMGMICCLTRAATAATFGKFTYTDNGTSITITDYPTAEVGAVEIPASINGKPVTIIGDGAFWGCVSLTSILIPNGVTTIERTAFIDCSSLTSITIGNNVTVIGASAFQQCGSLTSITIPEAVSFIGGAAFSDCTSLTSITIPNRVTSIEYQTFLGCVNLTSISIPSSVTVIQEYAFYGCTSLASITVPDSVTSIGEYAFYGCTNLTSISTGNGVISIGQSAFSNCTSLTDITVPDSVTSIGQSAFNNCTSLTSISTGNGVNNVQDFTFYGCSSLTNVTIGKSIQTIGNSAFKGCSSLMSVTFPDSLNYVYSLAFSNCNSLTRILFTGDAPGVGSSVFLYAYQSTVFYLPGTSGWKSNLGTRPTALWAPPVITNQPASVIVNPGENATFSVTASANAALPTSYQWQKNGIAMLGAVNSSLALTGIQAANIGNYTVVITNDAGNVVSAAAGLTIAAGNLYTQAQYDAALTSGFNLGVSSVTGNPSFYDLYTATQVKAIHVGTPLLAKDPVTGKFKLTIKARKSTDLANYADLDFSTGDTTINPAGEFEFSFTSGDAAAFFRLETK